MNTQRCCWSSNAGCNINISLRLTHLSLCFSAHSKEAQTQAKHEQNRRGHYQNTSNRLGFNSCCLWHCFLDALAVLYIGCHHTWYLSFFTLNYTWCVKLHIVCKITRQGLLSGIVVTLVTATLEFGHKVWLLRLETLHTFDQSCQDKRQTKNDWKALKRVYYCDVSWNDMASVHNWTVDCLMSILPTIAVILVLFFF